MKRFIAIISLSSFMSCYGGISALTTAVTTINSAVSIKNGLVTAMQAGDLTTFETLLAPFLSADGLSASQIALIYQELDEVIVLISQLIAALDGPLNNKINSLVVTRTLAALGSFAGAGVMLFPFIKAKLSKSTSSSSSSTSNMVTILAALGLIGFGLQELYNALTNADVQQQRTTLLAMKSACQTVQSNLSTQATTGAAKPS